MNSFVLSSCQSRSSCQQYSNQRAALLFMAALRLESEVCAGSRIPLV